MFTNCFAVNKHNLNYGFPVPFLSALLVLLAGTGLSAVFTLSFIAMSLIIESEDGVVTLEEVVSALERYAGSSLVPEEHPVKIAATTNIGIKNLVFIVYRLDFVISRFKKSIRA